MVTLFMRKKINSNVLKTKQRKEKSDNANQISLFQDSLS